MRFKIIIILLFISFKAIAQKKASALGENESLKKPVSFTHVPFLLLRFNPTTLLGLNNTWQIGAELAPPFGKFSFAFDYGKGRGSSNLNKYIRNNMSETRNLEYRGEIKMYFSDWFPFYALDKKPFGRYYSIEYIQATYDRTLPAFVSNGNTELPAYFMLDNVQVIEKNQRLHLKFGKHFHIHKHLFFDGYVGAGVGKFETDEGIFENAASESLPQIAHYAFLSNTEIRKPASAGWFFSRTAGLRIVVPL